MSKRIDVTNYVCPNCDARYLDEEDANDCISNHDFPKKVWVDLMCISREHIEKYLENISVNILGLTKHPFQGFEGLGAEGFSDAFSIKYLVEVNEHPPSVKILEMRPLWGVGYPNKYIIKIGHQDIITQIKMDNKEMLEAFKRGDEIIMAKIVERDGCPLCFKKEYPCGCWDVEKIVISSESDERLKHGQ